MRKVSLMCRLAGALERRRIGRQSKFRAEPTRYPVGVLSCGAEIHFLHYGSDAEALEKWQRRCARLREALADGEPVFIKLCDHNGTTNEQFAQFHAVPFGAKVSFGAHALSLPGHVGSRWLADRKTGRVAAAPGFTTSAIARSTSPAGPATAWCGIRRYRGCSASLPDAFPRVDLRNFMRF